MLAPLSEVSRRDTVILRLALAAQLALILRGLFSKSAFWTIKLYLLSRQKGDVTEFLTNYDALLRFACFRPPSTEVELLLASLWRWANEHSVLKLYDCLQWLKNEELLVVDEAGCLTVVRTRDESKDYADRMFRYIARCLYGQNYEAMPGKPAQSMIVGSFEDADLRRVVEAELLLYRELKDTVRIKAVDDIVHVDSSARAVLASKLAPSDSDIVSGNLQQFMSSICELRRLILASYHAQRRALPVIKVLLDQFSLILCGICLLSYLDVSASTLIVSGAAVFSGTTMALSFLYTDFIQSTMLTVFTNPYDHGDRVRLNNVLYTVKKINVYTTQFETLEGKVLYLPHVNLRSMQIVNESRSLNSYVCIPLRVSDKTTRDQLQALEVLLRNYLSCHSNDWLRDSLFTLVTDLQLGHYMELTIWATIGCGWGSWRYVHDTKTAWYHYLVRVAKLIGLRYTLPPQPVALTTKEAASTHWGTSPSTSPPTSPPPFFRSAHIS